MRMRATATFLLTLLTLSAVGCSNNDGPVDATSNGKIVGRITSSAGQPIAGAAITTVPSTQSMLSGADGSYSIADVAPGTYVVAAAKEGFNAGAASVTVAAGKTVTADIVLGTGPANGLPTEPTNPGPSDGAVSQPTELTLRWNASDPDNDTLRFDVLLGTSNPPTTVVTSNQLPRVHYLARLDSNTTYYWQVIARDNRGGVASGPVWRFRTEKPNENKSPRQPSNPIPMDGAGNIGEMVDLSWTASDPELDALVFDVYFGTTESPSRVASDVTTTLLRRSNLAPNAVYYWRVVARDNHGGETSGPLWRFTTGNTDPSSGGLVAYYPFDGDASDASGHGHNGELLGVVPTFDRHGSPGRAYHFGTDAFVSVPHSPELNFSGSFSIGAWIRLDNDQANYTGLVAKGPENTEYPGYMMLIMSGNVLGTATGQPGYAVVSGSRGLNDGIWHHVAMVVDAPTKALALYVDGVLERRQIAPTMSLAFTTPRPLLIGVERNGDNYFHGAIDEVRLYSRALSLAEIEQLSRQ